MRLAFLAAMILAMTGVARADDPKPEDLKKQYADTLVQLKAAQDRKAELASENEKLVARVADLEKQLAASKADGVQLQRQVDSFSDRTFFLRAHYAAWQRFLIANPLIRTQWEVFLDNFIPLPSIDLPFVDPDWPISAKG